MADSGLLVGKILWLGPQFAVMESLPGVADVYVPKYVLETSAYSLTAGQTLVVEARKHIEGNNKWRVTRIVNVIPSEITASLQPRQASPLPSSLAVGVQQNTKTTEIVDELVDALVRLVDEHGGEMGAQKLPLLYNAQPDAQAEVKAAGGLKGFCSKHSSRLRFISDGGPGRIGLCPAVETLVGLLESRGGEMSGADVQLLYKLHPRARDEVKAAGGLKGFCSVHAERLRFVSEAFGPGPGRVKLVEVWESKQSQVSFVQPVSSSSSKGSVLDCLMGLLEDFGGEMGAEKLALLYQLHSEAQEEIKRAGGAKAFCSLHAARIRFVVGVGAGKIVLCDHHQPNSLPQPRFEQLSGAHMQPGPRGVEVPARSYGVELAGASTSARPAQAGADQQLRAAPPAMSQVQQHSSGPPTRHGFFEEMFGVGSRAGPAAAGVRSTAPNIAPAPLAISRPLDRFASHDDTPAAREPSIEFDLAGTLVHRLAIGAFMESSPGVTDVYVPRALLIAHSPPAMVGDILLVRAVEHVQGGNKYKATRIIAVRPAEAGADQQLRAPPATPQVQQHSSGAPTRFSVEEMFGVGSRAGPAAAGVRSTAPDIAPAPLAISRPMDFGAPHEEAQSEASSEVDLAGTLIRAMAGGSFMESSPGGVTDVYVPKAVMDAHSPPAMVGDILLVRAVEHVQGGNKYRATRIIAVQASGAAPSTDAASETEEGERMTGRVTKLLPTCGFMESSPGGNSDVYIPLSVIQQQGERPREGDMLTVLTRRHYADKFKYKCVKILQQTRTARDLPDLHQDSATYKTPITLAALFDVGSRSGPAAVGAASTASAIEQKHNSRPLDPISTDEHTPSAGESSSEFDLAGTLTRTLPAAAFMESSPGVTDVYVPRALLIAHSPPAMVGDILLVRAVEHVQGGNKYRATRIIAVQASGAAPSTDAASETEEEESVRMTGRVTKLLPTCGFMESSPGGNSDVYIPLSVIQQQGERERVSEGGMLTVLARRHDVGKAKYKCVEILDVTSTGQELPVKELSLGSVASSVVDTLVELVDGHGGEMDGPNISMLYKSNPDAQAEVKAAGGLKGFCSKHSSRLRFISDGGPGHTSVGLCAAVETLVGLLESRGGEMSGADVQLLYKLHPRARDEVKAAGGLKGFCSVHAERLRFVSEAFGPGPGRVKLVEAWGGAHSQDQLALPSSVVFRDHHQPNSLPQPRFEQLSNAVLEPGPRGVEALARSYGVELAGASAAATLHPVSQAASGASSRPITLAALFDVGSRSGPAAVGAASTASAIAQTESFRPLDRFASHEEEQFESSNEVDLAGTLTRILPIAAFMESSPGVTDVYVPRALLIAHSPPAMVGDILLVRAVEHVQGGNKYRATRIIAVQASGAAPSTDAASETEEEESVRMTGRVTKLLPTCGFMESSPGGNSDVYIPLSVIQQQGERERVSEGGMLTVLARRHDVGKAKYKCVEILQVFAREDNERSANADKLPVARQKTQHTSTLTGKLINLLPTCAFMESSPGNSDVYIPLAVIQQQPEALREGDVLSVVAEAHEFGKNKYRCLEILQVVQRDKTGRFANAEECEKSAVNLAAGAKPAANLKARHDAPASGEWSDPPLLEAVIRLVVELGGVMDGSKVHLLYEQRPEAKEELRAAGGLKAFCKANPSRVKFVEDASAGKVKLRSRTAKPAVAARAKTSRDALQSENRFGCLEEDGEQSASVSSSSDSEAVGSSDSEQGAGAVSSGRSAGSISDSASFEPSSQPRSDESDASDVFDSDSHAMDLEEESLHLWGFIATLLQARCEAQGMSIFSFVQRFVAREPTLIAANQPTLVDLSYFLTMFGHFELADASTPMLSARFDCTLDDHGAKTGGPGEGRGARCVEEDADEDEDEDEEGEGRRKRRKRVPVGGGGGRRGEGGGRLEEERDASEPALLSALQQKSLVQHALVLVATATALEHIQDSALGPAEGAFVERIRKSVSAAATAVLSCSIHIVNRQAWREGSLSLSEDEWRIENQGCYGVLLAEASTEALCPMCTRLGPRGQHSSVEEMEMDVAFKIREATASPGTALAGLHAQASNVRDLFRAIRLQDDAKLATLLAVPADLPPDRVNLWWSKSWVPIFDCFAGVEMVLISDASMAARGSKGKLFPVLFKAVMGLFNACVKGKVDLARPKAFITNFVRRVATIPEFTVDERIQLAATTAKAVKPLVNSRFGGGPSTSQEGLTMANALDEAVGSCRPAVVQEMLGWGAFKDARTALGLQLHHVCSLQPPATSRRFALSCTSHNQQVERFRMAGFNWTVTAICTAHFRDLSSVKVQLHLVEAAELEKEGVLRTDVRLVAKGEANQLEARVQFSLAFPSATLVLPLVKKQATCVVDLQLSACDPAILNHGTKKVRSVAEWERDREEIVRLLLDHEADVDCKDSDGRLAWSIAIHNAVPKHVASLVSPSNLVVALNTVADSHEPVNMSEVLPLAKSLPSDKVLSIKLAGFVGRKTKDPSVSLSTLIEELLKREIEPESLAIAAGAAVSAKDWRLASLLLQRVPQQAGLLPRATPLHDAVAAKENDVLEKLLDLGVEADTRCERPGTGGETALHVACRVGNVAAVQTLVSRRCSLSLRELQTGGFPLHAACQASLCTDIVVVLLEGKADPSATNKWKQRPIDLTKDKEIRRIMLESEAKQKKVDAQPAPAKDAAAAADEGSAPGSETAHLEREPAESDAKPSLSVTREDPPSAAAPEPTPAVNKSLRLAAAWEIVDRLRLAPRIVSAVHAAPAPDAIDSSRTDSSELRTEQPSPDVHGTLSVASEAQAAPCSDVLKPPDQALVQTAVVSPHEAEPELENSSPNPQALAEERDEQGECGALDPIASQLGQQLEWSSQGLEWDLRCTREFKELLFSQEICSNQPLMQAMLGNLRRLASGEQGRGLMKLLKGTPKSLRIFESPCKTFNDGGRILWQFAVDYSPRIKQFSETIRLWKLCLSHDDVPKAIENIVQAHKKGRTSTVKRTLKASISGSCIRNGRRFPRTYEATDGDDPNRVRELLDAEELQFEQLVENDEQQQEEEDELVFTPPAVAAANSYNVLKFYALNGEVLHLASEISQGASQDFLQGSPEFPFIPDQKEDLIISSGKSRDIGAPALGQENSSVLLIGRSGTGKTSIALGRLWRQYEKWHSTFQGAAASASSGEEQYHQVFVTANKVLRDQVRKSFQGMRSGLLGIHTNTQNQDYPPTLAQVQEDAFPLFLTQSEWLSMLDGTLQEPFFPRNADGSLKERVESGFHEEYGMLESLPEDEDWLSENSDDDENWDLQSQAGAPSESGGVEHRVSSSKRKEVDSKMFHSVLWPRIKKRKPAETKQMSASTLFQEIHSYIKGSHLSLDKPAGFLSKEEYLHLPTKMAPNFKGLASSESIEDLPGDRKGSRDAIYDLFEEYEKEKRRLDAYDISDVIFHIWTRLQREGYAGPHIDSVFVDETQDFTQAELRLFIRICRDKNDMFFSGDTCQTIASGVGFRFEDLRSLFKLEQDHQLQSGLRLQRELTISVPRVSVLSLNYRTHNGILQAAAGIVDLLEQFFPGTIDFLPRESGFFDGPKPVLLSDTRMDDAALLIVGSDRSTSQIEFGAHQVILVRTQESKTRLPREFDSCLAMTVLESKGLEFDDVFLWNFLSESRAAKEWRVVLSYLIMKDDAALQDLKEEQDAVKDSEHAGMLRPLEFSEHAHLILCEELKQLYTAITRARVRVIIYEEDARQRAPMFHYLERRHLVEVRSYLNAGSHAPLTVQTSAQDWYKQGVKLRDNGMLLLAAKCFSKAGDERLENEVLGQHFADDAVRELGDADKRRATFFQAAECFLRAGRGSELSAARCFFSANELQLAAELFLLCGGTEHISKAIRCYHQLGDLGRTVALLVEHGRLKRALELLKKDFKAAEALEILDAHPLFAPPPELSVETFVQAALSRIPLGSGSAGAEESEETRRRVLSLIERLPVELGLGHLRRRGYRVELVQKLTDLGMWTRAALVLAEDGRSSEGAQLLEAAPTQDVETKRVCSELHLSTYLEPQPAGDGGGDRGRFDKVARALEEVIALCNARCTEMVDREGTGLPHPDEVQRAFEDCEAHRNRLRLLKLDWATRTKDLKLRAAALDDLHREKEEAAWNSPLATCLVEGARLQAVAASLSSNAGSGVVAEMFPWLWDVPAVLTAFDDLLGVMVQVRQREGAHTNIQEYLPCEQLFGFRRQKGMCTIRKSDREFMEHLLQISHAEGAKDPPIMDGEGFEVLNPADTFQPALTHFLSCKRLELLNVASAHIATAFADAQKASSAPESKREGSVLELRWTFLHMWCSGERSRAENWHWQNKKLFFSAESNLQQTGLHPKLLGQSHWGKTRKAVMERLTGLLVSRAGKGLSVRMQDFFETMPRAILSNMRNELNAQAKQLLGEWKGTQRADNKSATLLSTALCLLQSVGFDIRRDLSSIATGTPDGREWHPPLVQTGLPDLCNAIRLQRSGKPLTSSFSFVKYVSLHLSREPPIDTWVILENALAEASVALCLPTAPGAGSVAAAFLPLSVAKRVRRDRERENVDAEALLFYTLHAMACALRRQIGGALHASVAFARAAASIQAVLLNFLLSNPRSGTRWSAVRAAAFAQRVQDLPSEVCTSLRGWRVEEALALVPGATPVAASPTCLAAALSADGDALVMVRGDARSQRIQQPSDVELAEAQSQFVKTAMQAASHAGSAEQVTESVVSFVANAWTTVAQNIEKAFDGGESMMMQAEEHGEVPDSVELEMEQAAVNTLCRFLRRKLDVAKSEGWLESARAEAQAQTLQAGEVPGQEHLKDPFQRRERYSLYYEGVVTKAVGCCMAWFNNGRVLFDTTHPAFEETKNSFLKFRDLFASSIAPVLVHADAVTFAFKAISFKGTLVPPYAQDFNNHFSQLISKLADLNRILDNIDQCCAWREELEATQSELATVTATLATDVLPRADAFSTHLQSMSPHELYFPPDQFAPPVQPWFAPNSFEQNAPMLPMMMPMPFPPGPLGLPLPLPMPGMEWNQPNFQTMPTEMGYFSHPSQQGATLGPTDLTSQHEPQQEQPPSMPVDHSAKETRHGSERGVLSGGARCTATFYPDGLQYPAKVIHRTRFGYLVLFEGYEDDATGRQDTAASDIQPGSNVGAQPRSRGVPASADSQAQHHQHADRPEAGDELEQDHEDGEEVGWSVVPAKNAPRRQYHRFGAQQRGQQRSKPGRRAQARGGSGAQRGAAR